MQFLLLLSISAVFFFNFAEAQEAPELDDIVVKASPLHLWDELDATTTKSSVRRNAGIPDLTQPFSRLPGTQVNEASGLGSKATVIPVWAGSAGETVVSLDGFPVVTPLGTGFDLSLIPAGFISDVGVALGLDAILPKERLEITDLRPAPVGRLLLTPQRGRSNLGLSFQDPLTGTAYGTYAFHLRKHRFTAAAQTLSSNGQYHFRDPVTGNSSRRSHNDVASAGAALSHAYESDSGFRVKNLLLAHHKNRAISGSLQFPSSDRERDDFHFLGTSLQTKYIGTSVSGSHSRVGTYGSDSLSAWSTTDRLYGSNVAVQIHKPERQASDAWVKPILQVDHEYNWYAATTGRFHRSVFGVNGVFQIKPSPKIYEKWPISGSFLMRQDVASEFSGARDYRFALEAELSPRSRVMAGFSYDHLYPSLTAAHGYVASWGRVLGNETLGVERHRMWNAGFFFERQVWKIYFNTFFDTVTNRSALRFLSPTTSRYVSLPSVWNTGASVDFTWLPVSNLSFRFSPTLNRAYDREFKRDLAYKPRWHVLSSLGFRFFKRANIFVEETALARRRYSSPDSVDGTGEDYLRPLFLTALRLEWNFGEGLSGKGNGSTSHQLFLRINNLFDRAGWDYPGYPMPGRTFWVGYVFGG